MLLLIALITNVSEINYSITTFGLMFDFHFTGHCPFSQGTVLQTLTTTVNRFLHTSSDDPSNVSQPNVRVTAEEKVTQGIFLCIHKRN